MDVVTFETAKALKDAGFPQPKTAFGQMWYFEESGTRLLILKGGANPNYVMEGALLVFKDYIKDMSIVYAPTAMDLLRDLPEDTHLYIADVDGERLFVPSLFEFVENETIKYDDGLMAGCDISEPATNPAEACAAAWLELNKQTND